MYYKNHCLPQDTTVREALIRLDELSNDAVVFIINDDQQLKGALTDGDVRRGLINGLRMEDSILKFLNTKPKFVRKGEYSIQDIIRYRQKNIKVLPVVDNGDKIINIINFRFQRSYLPVDAVVMAGGKGKRLRPLTENTPKPLLKVGDKPIMEHNLDRLTKFGIDDFWVTVNYLGRQIEDYFGSGADKNIRINYLYEDKPLGTIGAIGSISHFANQYILLTNSDILTNIDYEHFFLDFLEQEADLAVVTIPYRVNVPYAVLENSGRNVESFKEKPTYTYYSNGGIYLIKKEVLSYIPKDEFYDATDFMEQLIQEGCKVVSYPLSEYWLDVGKHEDFQQAQEDINKIKFD